MRYFSEKCDTGHWVSLFFLVGITREMCIMVTGFLSFTFTCQYSAFLVALTWKKDSNYSALNRSGQPQHIVLCSVIPSNNIAKLLARVLWAVDHDWGAKSVSGSRVPGLRQFPMALSRHMSLWILSPTFWSPVNYIRNEYCCCYVLVLTPVRRLLLFYFCFLVRSAVNLTDFF